MGQANSCRQTTKVSYGAVAEESSMAICEANRLESLKENNNAKVASVATELAPSQPVASLEEKPQRSVESSEQDLVDVFALDVPRRPRSKRNTTVLKLANFTFRDLPSMYNGQSQSTEAPARETQEKTWRKAPRKPKSDAAPQRIVVEDILGQRRHTRKPRAATRNGLLLSASIDSDEPFLTDKDLEFLGSTKSERIQPVQRKAICKADRKDGMRKRSLRVIIDKCVRQQRSKNPPTPSPVVKPRCEVPQLIPPRRQQTFSPEEVPTAGMHMDCCPTISCLLMKGALRAGDYVELITLDSNLTIRGWVTHRGILCSHCALVHSCKLFGVCADFTATKNRMYIKDGRSISQLLR